MNKKSPEEIRAIILKYGETLPATKIVNAILNDISDRAGLGDEMGQLDNDIKEEIKLAWTTIVMNIQQEAVEECIQAIQALESK